MAKLPVVFRPRRYCMKAILAIGALLSLATLSYWNGHARGYKQGVRDRSSFTVTQSNCYVAGEAHNADAIPCVTIDGGAR
jgi:hypothetical protein